MSDRRAVSVAADSYRLHTHRAGEAEGYLVNRKGEWFFGVRGTEFDYGAIIWKDGLIDALCYPWRDRVLGWCHKGFLHGRLNERGGARGLWREAMGALSNIKEPVTYVGHSKGGAQAAMVCALHAYYLDIKPKALITFGCPKYAIGSRMGEILKDVPTRNYWFGGDPVPTLPIMPWWRRHGETVYLDPIRGLTNCIKDHRILRYQAVVR